MASLGFSTYLGGGGNTSNSLGDIGFAIAADQSGLAYVTGQTVSDSSVGSPFPTTSNALQSSLTSVNGNAFLTVLDTYKGGTTGLVYSTFLGGASQAWGDYGQSIAVDGSGNAYITGQTLSGASGPFPTTAGAYQTTLNSAYGNVFVTE
ncbi:MAG TPA: SBBP repeat-containing protein, partial [Candidatus Acidoferrales bacterium]|nr:SBBP repeat-containing protein [Candidatus Acidoferrales bacterium]